MEIDRRDDEFPGRGDVPLDAFQGTTVLTNDQLQRLIDSVRERDQAPPEEEFEEPGFVRVERSRSGGWSTASVVIAVVIAFLVGSAIGFGVIWLRRL
jgi:hypothetical protein